MVITYFDHNTLCDLGWHASSVKTLSPTNFSWNRVGFKPRCRLVGFGISHPFEWSKTL